MMQVTPAKSQSQFYFNMANVRGRWY